MKQITSSDLLELSLAAAGARRRRQNRNLHSAAADPIQRMLNAFEPATYVRPHRHADKWELFIMISGRAAVLNFDDRGCVSARVDLDAVRGTRVVEIPENTWHTIVSLEPKTVMFEVKAGPYVATAPEDFAGWAPPEGDAAASAFEHWAQTAAVGDRSPRNL